MKVLILGGDEVHAIENFYVKYMTEEGVEVRMLPIHRFFNEYYYKSILNKIKYRLGLSSILKKINSQVREAIEDFNPDFIFVFKGMELYPETLAWAKSRNIRLAVYNPDNPFIFTGRGSGNKNIGAALPLYDIHFTYNRAIERRLKESYGSRVVFLPF